MEQNKIIIYDFLIIILIFSISLNGCALSLKQPDPRETQIYAYLRLEKIKEAIKNGYIKQGMRCKELSSLIGEPDRIIQIELDRQLDAQWIYEDRTGPMPKYFSFHFQDGALIDW